MPNRDPFGVCGAQDCFALIHLSRPARRWGEYKDENPPAHFAPNRRYHYLPDTQKWSEHHHPESDADVQSMLKSLTVTALES